MRAFLNPNLGDPLHPPRGWEREVPLDIVETARIVTGFPIAVLARVTSQGWELVGSDSDHELDTSLPWVQFVVQYKSAHVEPVNTEGLVIFVADPDGSTIHPTMLKGLKRLARRAEEMLSLGETYELLERYRRLFGSIREAVAEVNMNGMIVAANQAFCALTGYSSLELSTMTYVDLTPEEWHAKENLVLHEQVLSRGYSDPYTKEYLRKDGTRVTIELQVFLLRDPLGNDEGMWAIVRDISSQIEAQRALETAARRLELAISATSDAVWEWNPETQETYYSPRWYEMLGYPGETFAMTREVWDRICHPDDLPKILDSMERAMRHPTGQAYDCEYRVLCADGLYRWIRGRGAVVERYEDGRPKLLSGTNADIHDKKEAELAQLRMAEVLEQKVQERTSELAQRTSDLELFTYALAHDLRGPLRHLSAYSSLLAESMGDHMGPESLDYVAKVKGSAKKMSDMLDGVLTLARLSARDVRPSHFRLGVMVQSVLDQFSDRREGVDVDVTLVDDFVYGEVESGEIVLRNLLDNAIKFRRPDAAHRVIIDARVVEGECLLSVSDNGMGFGEEEKERLFTMFARGESSVHGTGIGLAVVARAAERLGGRIEASSEPGNETRFSLRFPCAPPRIEML